MHDTRHYGKTQQRLLLERNGTSETFKLLNLKKRTVMKKRN